MWPGLRYLQSLQISTDGMNMINYDPRQFYAETEGGSSFKYM
jgi:hypothetical protein